MYLISDAINSYGGCFPPESLEQVKNLIADSPVLIGHQKDKLPIARNFHAEIETKENRVWVKTYFYWLKEADHADDLLKQIDGGIYKECSIGFTFLLPECSICQKDIRTCRHTPLEEYRIGRQSQLCFFYYKEIDKVLETSLVYRGANPDTSISDNLVSGQDNFVLNQIDRLDELDCSVNYLVMPAYDGLMIDLNQPFMENCKIDSGYLKEMFEYNSNQNLMGLLIGFRGKERCSKKQLLKYLSDNKGPIKRLEFRYLPARNRPIKEHIGNNLLKPIKYHLAQFNQLTDAINLVKTKEGVMLLPLTPNRLNQIYIYQPKQAEIKPSLTMAYLEKSESCLMTMTRGANSHQSFLFKNFKLKELLAGKRLIAEKTVPPSITKSISLLKCDMNELSSAEVSTCCQIKGDINGVLFFKPIVFNRKPNLYLIWLNHEKENHPKGGVLV